jgi:hypothetical protein
MNLDGVCIRTEYFQKINRLVNWIKPAKNKTRRDGGF